LENLKTGLAEKRLILQNASFFVPFTTVDESKREKNFDIINAVTV
jgi:hypothetical protein